MMTEGLIDVHSHILPGIDDGAKNMETAMKMVRLAYSQGVRSMVATPHYYPGHRNAGVERIRDAHKRLQSEISKEFEDFTLHLGQEIYYKENVMDLLKSKEIFTMAESKYILLEFPVSAEYQYIYQAVRRCLGKGYYPILAHVERYHALYRDRARMEELIAQGAYIQVNAENFIGNWFQAGRGTCLNLIKDGLVHFIGSDCHNMDKRKPDLGPAADFLKKKLLAETYEKLLLENPEKLLQGKFL